MLLEVQFSLRHGSEAKDTEHIDQIHSNSFLMFLFKHTFIFVCRSIFARCKDLVRKCAHHCGSWLNSWRRQLGTLGTSLWCLLQFLLETGAQTVGRRLQSERWVRHLHNPCYVHHIIPISLCRMMGTDDDVCPACVQALWLHLPDNSWYYPCHI